MTYVIGCFLQFFKVRPNITEAFFMYQSGNSIFDRINIKKQLPVIFSKPAVKAVQNYFHHTYTGNLVADLNVGAVPVAETVGITVKVHLSKLQHVIPAEIKLTVGIDYRLSESINVFMFQKKGSRCIHRFVTPALIAQICPAKYIISHIFILTAEFVQYI